MINNAFFKTSDRRSDNLSGYPINKAWWSRHYEYPWAIQFAEKTHVVADMGCGWSQRPLKDALADRCELVYAIDGNPKVLELPNNHANMRFMVADFTKQIPEFADGVFDRIFCISVLEDLGNIVPSALAEFGRLLKPDGKIVITFDEQYDYEKPRGPYPGVSAYQFGKWVNATGLRYQGKTDYSKDNAVVHGDWNLCVFHCVLVKT